MKSSEILREAARIVEADKSISWFGCVAIKRAFLSATGTYKMPKAAYEWFRLVRPEEYSGDGHGWWGSQERGPRIIGLCLAAAIAESEGD